MKRRLWLLRRTLFASVIGACAVALVATGASAHAPDWELSARGTATVDGLLSEAEWTQPAPVSFLVPLPSGGTIAASLWAMNDDENLYLAVALQSGSLVTASSTVFEFDNDHDGTLFESGDDVLINDPSLFDDMFRSACTEEFTCPERDVTQGGTSDGQGATTNNGVMTFYELSHPLDDADDAHDFSLTPGDTVGFALFLVLCDHESCAWTFHPGPLRDSPQGNVLIAGHASPRASGHGRFNTEGNGQVVFTISNDEVRFDRIRGQRFSFTGEVESVTGEEKTATLTGTGTFNGQSGYTFAVSVVDKGGWGRLEDTIDVVIRDPAGAIVFTSFGPQVLKQGDVSVTPAESG